MQFVRRHPLFLLFLLGLAVLAWQVFERLQAPSTAAAFGNFPGAGGTPPVRVSEVGFQVIAERVETVGTTVANESVDVVAKVSDTISKLHFEDGDFVERGEILAELTNEAEAARLTEVRAGAEEARRQYERLQVLVNNKLVSATELDQARSAMEMAEARLEGELVAMKDRVVRAPFSGMLGFRQVSEGSMVSNSTVLTTLDDISVVKLDFTIPEVHLAAIAPGQRVNARSVVYPDRRFEGIVSVVGSRIDPVTRSVQVRARVDNPEALLRPGMLLTVAMAMNARDALVVPEQAVMQNRGRDSVFVVDADQVVEEVAVTLGRRQPGIVEVLSGLKPGDRVVSEGVGRVRPGQTVRVLETLAPPAAGEGQTGQPVSAS